jgi:NAD-dependent aldehyde dehydrogenases
MMAKSYSLGLHKTFIVELGGKDPAIVSKSADLDTAVEGILSSAFGYSGQKCSACSRVYVQESVKEEFISKLSERTRSLRIGNPLVKENYIGPLISQKSLIKFNDAVNEAETHGRIICGGKVADTGVEGIYVEPTIVEIDHSNRLFHEELFFHFL